MDDAIRKAGVLIEALSYIRQFRGRLTVIKLGGSCMEDDAVLRDTLQDIVFMETVGMRPILVHGGGKAISSAMEQAGLEPRFVRGRRYTDRRTLQIVARVLVEEINESIVTQIEQLGGQAAGLHYQTSQALFGSRMAVHDEQGHPVELGYVGEVTEVDTREIQNLSTAGVVPVIPSLALDLAFRASPPEIDHLLNVNADTAAAAVACQLRAEKLVMLTDMAGILRDRNDPASKATSLTTDECRQLLEQGVIGAGMIPKVQACLESLSGGVAKTHIIDGRLRHSLLLEIYTDQGVGSEIVHPRRST